MKNFKEFINEDLIQPQMEQIYDDIEEAINKKLPIQYKDGGRIKTDIPTNISSNNVKFVNGDIIKDYKIIGLVKKERHSITKFKEYDINEGFSWILTIASAFLLYKFIKSILKHKKFSKMSSDEIENYKRKEKYKKNYQKLIYYVKDYLKNDNKVKFSENFLHYIFKLGDLEIKIDKQNKTIFWNYIRAKGGFKPEWEVGKRIEFTDIDSEEFSYIEPIPIS